MKNTERLFVKISKSFLPYIILLIIIGIKGGVVISFLLVFIHELVHYLTAKRLGFKGVDIEILPIGTVLKLKKLDEAEPKEDLIISLSGPLSNLFLAFVFYLLNRILPNYYLRLLCTTNLTLGAFNLIPALPLDGGRILRDILSFRTLYKRANRITVKVSMIIGFFMLSSFGILFLHGIKNINIGIIGVFIIIISYKEKERIVYLIMGDIIRKKYKFMKKGYIENKSISIYYKKTLLEALSIVDKNKYNIFTVLNSDMKVINNIYENELIEALKVYGNITIKEYLNSIDEIDKMDKWADISMEEWKEWKEEINK
ncbi:M50 family metallopeptidase [Clostridium aestuarii]|uniref:M50 family metallopeptidase n=1 Tax=Clostridium aestuarii TaxID=338193 RepID=A0ABT4CZ76_9CLOT|nr:M50 family metallopeptidase [Clostridium aestuarii]MCY6484291.1 M50 family metallopeptidase [Clostridium aestuarii]